MVQFARLLVWLHRLLFFLAILKASRNPQRKQILSKYWSSSGKERIAQNFAKMIALGKKKKKRNRGQSQKSGDRITELEHKLSYQMLNRSKRMSRLKGSRITGSRQDGQTWT